MPAERSLKVTAKDGVPKVGVAVKFALMGMMVTSPVWVLVLWPAALVAVKCHGVGADRGVGVGRVLRGGRATVAEGPGPGGRGVGGAVMELGRGLHAHDPSGAVPGEARGGLIGHRNVLVLGAGALAGGIARGESDDVLAARGVGVGGLCDSEVFPSPKSQYQAVGLWVDWSVKFTWVFTATLVALAVKAVTGRVGVPL